MFGEGDFLTTEISQGQVCYTEVKCHVPESTPEPAAMLDESGVGRCASALRMAFPGLPVFCYLLLAPPRPIPR